ncbi:hypothetical protein AB0H51_27900 [Streptomyces griseoluteus]|uniref:hypothetical protein n=1 Tax=Streptomyces griseoluteus TaxID=29306 RepID=UPI0033CE8F0D
MSNIRERDAIADLLHEQVAELAAALKPYGQTLLEMVPEAWSDDDVPVHVAYRGFEVAKKVAGWAGLDVEMATIAEEHAIRVEYRRLFPDGPPRLGPQ